MQQQRGSALVATMVFIVVLGGMTAALSMLSVSSHRSARQSLELRKASRAAESALGYFVLQLEIDPNYFATNPAPQAPLPVGNTMFRLDAVTPGAGDNDWQVDVITTSDFVDYRVIAMIVDEELTIPGGMVLAGTGDPADDILNMNGASRFASYDPAVGTAVLNDNASIVANGSFSLKGTALIIGDAIASGWISSVGPSGVTGARIEVADEIPIDPYEVVIDPVAAASVTTNDNGNMNGVFGAGWTSVPGPDNSGDLSLSGGSYTLTAGTYRVRNLAIESGTDLTLDTSGGPITFVCTGSVDVDSGSTVQIDAGGTENGLVTVLEDGVPFTVQGGSSFGQEAGGSESAGYSQILSTGGSGDINCQGGSSVWARVAAPTRDLFVGGSSTWYGSAVARTANLIGSGPKFFIDESRAGTVVGSTGEYEVAARWRGVVSP